MADKTLTFSATLIGKSAVRHAEGGFILTFQAQTKLGLVEIKHWVSKEDGEMFPLTEMKDKIVDGKVVLDEHGAPVQETGAHLNKGFKFIIVSEDSLAGEDAENSDSPALAALLSEAKQQNEALEEELSLKDAEIAEAKGRADEYAEQLATVKQELADKSAELEAAKVEKADAAAAAATSNPTTTDSPNPSGTGS